jgi:hypothetical protein
MEKTKYNDHEKLKFESFKHLETLTKGKKHEQELYEKITCRIILT